VHGARISYWGAIVSASAVLVTSVSSLFGGLPSPDHIVELAIGGMCAGFLYFVRQWINDQKEADRRVMDTVRRESEQRQEFERKTSEALGLIMGHLGLSRADFDPAILINSGAERRVRERRVLIERREGGSS
jgi:hypothetical protein